MNLFSVMRKMVYIPPRLDIYPQSPTRFQSRLLSGGRVSGNLQNLLGPDFFLVYTQRQSSYWRKSHTPIFPWAELVYFVQKLN